MKFKFSFKNVLKVFIAVLVAVVLIPICSNRINADDVDYLSFTSTGDSSISFSFNGETSDLEFEYKLNSDWTTYELGTILYLSDSDTVYFRNSSEETTNLSSEENYYFFDMSGSLSSNGDITTLINKNGEVYELPCDYCFTHLFSGCNALTSVPKLPSTVLTEGCYSYMFEDCTSIESVRNGLLPALQLAKKCYDSMFLNCESLSNAPELPASFLADASKCYQSMFNGCSSLEETPNLPALALSTRCYAYMFANCSSLTAIPSLNVTGTLPESCYQGMFANCSSLKVSLENTIDAPATYAIPMSGEAIDGTDSLKEMFYGTDGFESTFINSNNGTPEIGSIFYVSGVLLLEDIFEEMPNLTYEPSSETTGPLCFEAFENNSTIKLVSSDNTNVQLETSTNLNSWFDYTIGQEFTLNSGDKLYFRNKSEETTQFSNQGLKITFEMTGKIGASGDTTTLLNKNGGVDELPGPYCFIDLFCECEALVSAPALPSTVLTEGCYTDMFAGCTSLTSLPALPATTVEPASYYCMFDDCSSITSIPNGYLPATILAEACYQHMFSGCTSLVSIPANLLPATGLATGCYSHMFYGCRALETIDANFLPATTLAPNCYQYMFGSCVNLDKTPNLPATTLARSCYYGMFTSCASLSELPELPATSLIRECYKYMFRYCTGINLSTTSGGSYTIPYRIPSSGTGTVADYSLLDMFANINISSPFAGSPDINTTYYLKDSSIVPVDGNHTISYRDMNDLTFSGIHSQGTPFTHTDGTDTALTAPTKAGFDFKGWFINSNCTGNPIETLSADGEYNAEIILYAKWESAVYTINYINVTDNGTVLDSGSPTTHSYGHVTPLFGASRPGYSFGGWYKETNFITPITSLGATEYNSGPINVYAKWTGLTYNIIYNNMDNATHGDDYPNTHTNGEATTLVEPTKEGFTFDGWYDNVNFVGQPIETISSDAVYTSDINVYAKWTEQGYTTYHIYHYLESIDGSSYVYNESLDSGDTVLSGSSVTLNNNDIVEIAGFDFDNDNSNNILSIDSIDDDNCTFKLYYTRKIYTITFDTDGGNAIAPISYKYEENIATPETPTKNGYLFVGWTPSLPEKMPHDNITITATWQSTSTGAQYKVEHWFENVNGDGQYTINNDYTETSAAVVGTEITATPLDIPGFYTDSPVTATLDADGSLVMRVYYKRNTYTITFNTDGGNEIEAIELKYGVELPHVDDPTKEGYDFAGWSPEPLPTTMPVGGLNLVAQWVEHEVASNYTVQHYLQNIENDEYTMDPTLTDHLAGEIGDEVTATPKNIPGFTADPRVRFETTVSGTMILKIYYTRNTYTITFDTQGGNEIEPMTLKFDAPITAPENPTKAGCSFTEWSPSIPEKMPANDLTILALWDGSSFNITYKDKGNTDFTGTWPEGTSIPSIHHFGTQTNLVNPTKPGWAFGGWFTNPDCSGNAITSLGAEDYSDSITLYANWVIQNDIPYKVEYHFENANDSNYSIDNTYTENKVGSTGSIVTAEVKTKNGFVLNEMHEHSLPSTTINVDGSTILKLYYKRIVNTLSFDSDGGSEVADITSKYGSNIVTPVNPTKDGYEFGGWMIDETVTNLPITMPLESKHYVAKWLLNSVNYKVVHYFEKADGSDYLIDDLKTTTLSAECFSNVDIVPLTEGIDGFEYDSTIPGSITSITLSTTVNNNVLKAYYKRKTHDVIFDKDNTEDLVSYTHRFGETLNLTTEAPDPTTFTKQGYTFDRWNISFPTTMPDADVTIKALWKANEYAINYYDMGGADFTGTFDDSESSHPVIHVYDNETLLVEPSRAGYTFDGWYTDSNCTEGNEITSLGATDYHDIETINLYAKWQGTTVTINYNLGYDGEEIPLEWASEHTNGIPTTLPVLSTEESGFREGYKFNGWFLDAEFTGVAVSEIKAEDSYTEDIQLYANWLANGEVEYKVEHYLQNLTQDGYELDESYNGNGSGTIEVLLPEPIVPIEIQGFTFEVDNDENTKYEDILGQILLSSNPEENVIKFYYTRNLYTISFNTDSEDYEDFEKEFLYGADIVLDEDPIKTGYIFGGWDPVLPETMPVVVEGENDTYTATWNPKTFEIIYKDKGGLDFTGTFNDTEEVTHVTTHTYGTPTELPAISDVTRDGYTLYGWYRNVDCNDTEASLTIGAYDYTDGDTITLYAKWYQGNTPYKILYYIEPLDNEADYELHSTDELPGLTDQVIDLSLEEPKIIDGFEFDPDNDNNVLTGTVTYDGSLVLKMYYTRNVYMISFNTGECPITVNPIETKFGAPIIVEEPTWEGHHFAGWDPELPETMPVVVEGENDVYTASWNDISNTYNMNTEGSFTSPSANDSVSSSGQYITNLISHVQLNEEEPVLLLSPSLTADNSNSDEFVFVGSKIVDMNSDPQVELQSPDGVFEPSKTYMIVNLFQKSGYNFNSTYDPETYNLIGTESASEVSMFGCESINNLTPMDQAPYLGISLLVTIPDNHGEDDPEEPLVDPDDIYEIEGPNSIVKGDDLVFTSNADYSKFVNVYIDDVEVNTSDYTSTSGSTIITFRSGYSNDLTIGTHSIKIVSNDGYAFCRFRVTEPGSSDEPSDNPSDNPRGGNTDPNSNNKAKLSPEYTHPKTGVR